jgi:hypothetical protein
LILSKIFLTNSSITLVDPLGRIVKTQPLTTSNFLPNKGFEVELSLQNIPDGYYYVRIKVGKALKTLPVFVAASR